MLHHIIFHGGAILAQADGALTVGTIGAEPAIVTMNYNQMIIQEIIGSVFSIIGLLISYILHTRMKNREAADVLDKAIQNSLGLVENALTSQPNTAKAIDYVLSKPNAVKRIGVSAAEIDDSIKARLKTKILDARLNNAAAIVPPKVA